MPHTYSNLLTHAVFSTKERRRLISSEIKIPLHAYVGGIIARSVLKKNLRLFSGSMALSLTSGISGRDLWPATRASGLFWRRYPRLTPGTTFFRALRALNAHRERGRFSGTTCVGGLVVLVMFALAKPSPAQIHFRDVTQAAGLRFVHNNGAFGKKYLPETLGPGCAFLDYDGDGWQDILLINGQDWPGHARRGRTTLKLYRNNRNGTFTDVTARAGLAVSLYGMGVAVGDYDNDGHDDIFVSALGQSRLFHNNGNGTFTDVTNTAGLAGVDEFSTSTAFVDYDKDGRLDLVVANYVQWAPQTDLFCTLDGANKSYCTPESYKGASARLWHNLGSGKFEDATRKAGLYDTTSKGLGIAILDYDGDGWPDIMLANDTQPNKLWLNNKDGTFTEKGVTAGVAFSEEGSARAGMGVDAADYDRSGRPSIIISNFSNQMLS